MKIICLICNICGEMINEKDVVFQLVDKVKSNSISPKWMVLFEVNATSEKWLY